MSLIISVLLLPLVMWVERSQRFRMLDPLEQNLQRASHGAALIALVLIPIFIAFSLRQVADLLAAAVADPADHWVPLLAFLPLTYGLVRFAFGVWRCWGARDGMLVARALFKLTVGVVGWWQLSIHETDILRAYDFSAWIGIAVMVLYAVAIWCVVTGTVRFLLLTLTWRGTARAAVDREIEDTGVVFRPVTRRPWWRFS